MAAKFNILLEWEKFFLEHNGLGVVIHPNVIIGDDVTIYQNVTIGKKNPQYSGGQL